MYEKKLTFNFDITEFYPHSFTVVLDKPWAEMTEKEKRTVIEKNWFDVIKSAERASGLVLGQLVNVEDEETGEAIDCYD